MSKKLLLVLLSVFLFVVCSLSYFHIPSSPYVSYKIAIDGGHGGIDKGVYGVNSGVAESVINLKIANYLKTALENNYFSTVLTRTDENGLYGEFSQGFKMRDMLKRKEIILSFEADALISIHCNSSSYPNCRGIVIYYDGASELSTKLAKCVANQIDRHNLSDKKVRIDREEKFMTTKIGVPGILIECGFLSTPSDEQKLLDDSYLKILSKAIALGVFDGLYS